MSLKIQSHEILVQVRDADMWSWALVTLEMFNGFNWNPKKGETGRAGFTQYQSKSIGFHVLTRTMVMDLIRQSVIESNHRGEASGALVNLIGQGLLPTANGGGGGNTGPGNVSLQSLVGTPPQQASALPIMGGGTTPSSSASLNAFKVPPTGGAATTSTSSHRANSTGGPGSSTVTATGMPEGILQEALEGLETMGDNVGMVMKDIILTMDDSKLNKGTCPR